MKARHRKQRASGGETGVKTWEADLKTKPTRYSGGKPAEEAEERKQGGKVHGMAKHRADRKPRKNGGRAGSNMNPFSSARNGTNPPGHKASIAD